jgi:hypothetical protein
MRTTTTDRRATDEGGTAMIIALFFTILVTGAVVTGSILMTANRHRLETNFRVHSQATQFARSGLTEALTWFRLQTNQPVTAFEPIVDEETSPPALETDDPEVGLVREYKIQGNLWGRYEVWKQWDADPDPERLAWRQRMCATDVSTLRGLASTGDGWRLRSIGHVFMRHDRFLPFDEPPNRVVAVQMLEAEILRIRVSLPGQAALSVFDGNSAHINTMGRIIGGATGAGIFYPDNSGTPTIGPPNANRVTGNPPLAPSASFDGAFETVFGVDRDTFRGMATDVVTTDAGFPSPVPDFTLLYAEAAAFTFNADRPLRGTGLVYIKGNVSLVAGNDSDFQGMLYIDGNLTLREPSLLTGAVVCTGDVTVQGALDYATIRFDQDVLDNVRRHASLYRWHGVTRPVLSNE